MSEVRRNERENIRMEMKMNKKARKKLKSNGSKSKRLTELPSSAPPGKGSWSAGPLEQPAGPLGT